MQQTQSKTNDNLSTNNGLSTVHKDQLKQQTNHKQTLSKRNLFSHLAYFSLFERWTRHSRTRFKSTNDKKAAELSQNTNGSAAVKEKSAYNYENNSRTFKNSNAKIAPTNKQRTKDCEMGRFQGIRVLFSKNRKRKKSNRNKQRQDIEMQLDDQIEDEKNDQRNEDDLNGDDRQTAKADTKNCDIKNAKKQGEQMQEAHRMRKSNTFSDLETVKDQQKINVEINNNQTDSQKRRRRIDKNNLKISNPSLALLSPSTIGHQTRRRLSAHAEIQETSQPTAPLTPTTSTNPINSIQPVLVRTLGSNQVLTEQKATKVLGVVFFSFVFCWAPFFCHNFLAGVSPALVSDVPKSVVSLLQWLGYLSSTLNPIIYTIFNAHFRRTFRKIILCQNLGVTRNKLKNSSPRLTASRMVSFRNSSFSRNQSSSISRKKAPPTNLPTNRSTTESSKNNKTSSFTCSTRSQKRDETQINEQTNELCLAKDEIKATEKDKMLDSNEKSGQKTG